MNKISSIEDTNRRLAIEFLDLALNERDPIRAFKDYMGSVYIQHGVYAGDGIDGALALLVPWVNDNPELRIEIRRVLADDDLVAVHHHVRLNPNDRGLVIVDIFRFEDGKIVEHWDVIQEVPEKSLSPHPMA